MLRRLLLEPFFLEGNEIELISGREQHVKPVLIDEIAETSVGDRSFYKFVIPGLRKIAQLGGRAVADLNLMRRISDGRTEASELVL